MPTEEMYYASYRALHRCTNVFSFPLVATSCRCLAIRRSTRDILKEAKTVIERWPKRVFHWLWLHPQFLPTIQELTAVRFLFHGFKIHPYIHDWHTLKAGIAPVLEMAQILDVPILLHTGGNEYADTGYHLMF